MYRRIYRYRYIDIHAYIFIYYWVNPTVAMRLWMSLRTLTSANSLSAAAAMRDIFSSCSHNPQSYLRRSNISDNRVRVNPNLKDVANDWNWIETDGVNCAIFCSCSHSPQSYLRTWQGLNPPYCPTPWYTPSHPPLMVSRVTPPAPSLLHSLR